MIFFRRNSVKPFRSILCLALFGLVLAPVCPAGAQIVTENGAEPVEGVVRIALQEQWRVGGEDDDTFFGAVSGTIASPDGGLYILDSQLSQVQVYGPDGTWLRTLSGEGDGPGEVRNPGSFFLDRTGEICMLNGMSGGIVRVTPDNLPADPYRYVSPSAPGGSLTLLVRAEVAGDGLAIAGIRISFGQAGGNGQHYFLSYCDAQGAETKPLLQKSHPIDYSDFRLDELEMDFAWNRWAVDAAGSIYVAPERNEYRIDVYGTDGALKRSFTRAYESYRRDAEMKRIANLVVEGVGAYHPVPLQGATIEETEPDITGMWFDPDGNLCVQTSRGDREKPDGAYSLYDVFSPDGVFLRQAALICDADPQRDGLSMLRDGRIVVVTGILDAWLTQQAVERSEAEQDAAEENPLEVVVYRME